MRDWLTIECEKGNDSRLREFIQANPILEATMRTLLANYLNLSEPNLQRWIQEYEHGASEFLNCKLIMPIVFVELGLPH